MRRWLKRSLLGLLAVVAIAVQLVVLALALASTPLGSEKLRGFVLNKANATLSGSLDIERLRFGVNHLVLNGVTLRDPDGEKVAEVEAVEVRVSLGKLLHKTI